MTACGTNGSVLCFVLQDDYIPYPSIEEVGGPDCTAAYSGFLPEEIMTLPIPTWERILSLRL